MFTAPQSSSPPATPDKSRRNDIAEPSTTPAGPPPSSYTDASFTPQGPPPSSVFGSSQLKFGQSSTQESFGLSRTDFGGPPKSSSYSNAPGPHARTKNGTPGRAIMGSSAFTVPDSSPFQETDDEEQNADGDEDEDVTDSRLFESSIEPIGAPRGLKRSSRGEPKSNALVRSGEKATTNEQSAMTGIAKSMAARAKAPALHESDDLILKTENIIGRIYHLAQKNNSSQHEDILKLIKDLAFEWKSLVPTDSEPGGVGPKEKPLPLTKANYLGSLLLHIHHPTLQPSHDPSISLLSRSNISQNINRGRAGMARQTPVPKALLDWLNQYHNPFPNDFEEVSRHQPSSTAHEEFWGVLFGNTLRGRIVRVINLLREADFGCAQSALDDGYDEAGYQGDQLRNVNAVIARAVQLLELCPAVSGDWDVRGKDWALFRHQVERQIVGLEAYAEGDSQDRDDEDTDIRGSRRRGKALSLSTASRRAESKVPWTIYENLKTLYGQLRGSSSEITVAAQDWVEASIYLTVWWDGEDGEIPRGSLSASRRSMTRSQTREVDIHPLQAYKNRLYASYLQVTKEPEDSQLTVDTSNPIHVGVACVFEDNVECVIDLISSWSMTLASALVEIGGLAGWLPEAQTTSNEMMDGFDNSDLMVLSYGEDEQQSDKWKATDIVILYSSLLSQKPNIWSSDRKMQREGWELAVQILSRVDSRQTANTKIGDLLDSLSLDTSDRVDKILNLCTRLSLDAPARKVAQKYAEHLQETSSNYGSALLYYARAHNGAKIKEVLNLLIAYSLVLSSAYPPQPDLDWRLKHFLTSPRDSLATLANLDHEAAELLSMYLSGYATLRKFYDLRDEEVNLPTGKTPEHRPLARKRAAAAQLMTVIDSASDSLRGGLYDPDADTVVPVDALLSLLGEALPLTNQSPRILSPPHLTTLLRATEDLRAAPSRLAADGADCLHAALTHARASAGADAPSPRALLLKKSASNVSSQFEMVGGSASGSGMWSSGERERERERTSRAGRGTGGQSSNEGSGVLVESGGGGKVERGWDWRVGLREEDVGPGKEGELVVRLVRVGVAEEVARGWLEGGE
ncbi:MAG: hypothetical protein Q9165_006933 [Trypethelium subeluteriae]